MSLEQSALPVFAGHQTFHPRFGWIKKGYDAVNADPEVFNNPEAPLLLGVGKNMVEAIRFWGIATKVWARIPHTSEKRRHLYVPTGFGKALLADDGFDPFLELPGSLWLLHWYALSSPTSLPVWWLTFNDFSAVEFKDEDLDRFCLEEVASSTWRQPNPSSIKKDVDCLLRMYTKRSAKGRQTLDDLLDSPFRELELIVPSGLGDRHFRFALGAKPTLLPEVLTYACLDYMARTDPHSSSATISRLTADPGSPGRLFKLSEESLLESLEAGTSQEKSVSIAAPGGSPQLLVDGSASDRAEKLLSDYYKAKGSQVRARPNFAFAGSLGRLPVDDNALVSSQRVRAEREAVLTS